MRIRDEGEEAAQDLEASFLLLLDISDKRPKDSPRLPDFLTIKLINVLVYTFLEVHPLPFNPANRSVTHPCVYRTVGVTDGVYSRVCTGVYLPG